MLNNLTLLELFLILKPYSDNTLLVGGCVRDYLLNNKPKDFDLVTDISLDIIISELLNNGWKIDEAGKQFLVLIASKNNQQFEIALYRKDGTYSDGRRPDTVNIGTIYDDALRRDLTINSLYLNPFTLEVIDPTYRGLEDLKNKVIRLNGSPKDRLQEDYLRILRVYRFASKLDFTIDNKTLKACRTYFEAMCENISPTRMMNEIEKICL